MMIDSQALTYISQKLNQSGFYADENIHSGTTEIRVGSGIKKGLPEARDASSISTILKCYVVYLSDQKIVVAVPTCGGKGKEWEFNHPKDVVELLEELLI